MNIVSASGKLETNPQSDKGVRAEVNTSAVDLTLLDLIFQVRLTVQVHTFSVLSPSYTQSPATRLHNGHSEHYNWIMQPLPTNASAVWPWPLPNKLTTKICLFAGREASAALCIALGHATDGESFKADAAREALFSEPFTYWDWRGLPAHDSAAKEQKRQRLWEYRKGFKIEHHAWQGYPTARERWLMFRSRIEEKEEMGRVDGKLEKDLWVKRIAMAHWMGEEDLKW